MTERKPCTKIRNSSPNDLMFRLTNISLALLCHGKPINRLKLLLYATFNFVNTGFVQSNHMGAQYTVVAKRVRTFCYFIKKEQTRVKRLNKSRKTVNLYLKYNMYK